jgi:hypothetical protein
MGIWAGRRIGRGGCVMRDQATKLLPGGQRRQGVRVESGTSSGRSTGAHLPFDVVGEHAQEDVLRHEGLDLGAVAVELRAGIECHVRLAPHRRRAG